ncbi:hypothetical protein SOVF_068940 [Spinacia oleracea]|nr:hypothetical protein SOVF_068940 [Spinacia oleracea]
MSNSILNISDNISLINRLASLLICTVVSAGQDVSPEKVVSRFKRPTTRDRRPEARLRLLVKTQGSAPSRGLIRSKEQSTTN